MAKIQVFARKDIRLPSNASESIRKKQAKAMKCELEVLMDIRHRHVISYVHHIITEHTMQIFTDYCEGGDLRKFMKNDES
jgi:serine/threonine protein kinase